MTTPTADAARLQALLVRSPLAVAFVDEGKFTRVSEPFNHLFGHLEDTELADSATRHVFVSDAAYAACSERLRAGFQAGQPVDEEFELLRRDGSRFWGRLQASPVDWQAALGESMWVLSDVTVARAARLAPTWTAKHDPVTELANRREFERRLAEHVGSRRNEPVSVLWLDLDRFGDIVTGMGGETADHFLYGIGQLLQTKVRATDTVARIEHGPASPCCCPIATSITPRSLPRRSARRSPATACAGACTGRASRAAWAWCCCRPRWRTPDAVLAAATLACGEAKAAGGDCVRVFVSTAAFDTVGS